jgi:di/tricarboxylate transporter
MTMNENSRVDKLLRDPSFARCSRQSLARLLPHLEERSLSKGDVLYGADGDARAAFLVLDGELIAGGDGHPEVRVTRGWVGEEAAIGLRSYLSEVKAAGAARVLVWPRVVIGELVKDAPELGPVLTRSFADRCRGRSPTELPVSRAAPETGRVSLKEPVGWLLAILLPVLLYFQLRDSASIPNEQALYFLLIISSVVVMWAFQLLPDFVPAIFAVLAVVLLGLAPSATVLSGFASESFFMALSVLGLGALISSSGLGYRFLLLLLRLWPTSKWWHTMSLFVSGFLLTPVVPTANGRVAILSPFVGELLNLSDPAAARRDATRLTAGALSGVSLFSAVFLSSKSMNFFVFGALPLQEQTQFSWPYWLFAASVCGIALLLLYLLISAVMFPTRGAASLSRGTINEQLRVLGPMTVAEWAALSGLALFTLGVATNAIHHIGVSWVALAIFYSLLMFGFVSKRQFVGSIDWAFLFFLGSVIGLVATMREVRVDEWLSTQISWLNAYMASNFEIFILMLAASIFLVRAAIPINATIVIFVTLLLPHALNVGVNPWLVGFVILFLAESFVLPYQASYYMQYLAATEVERTVNARRLALFNLTMFGAKILVIYVSLTFWHHLGLL